MYELALHADADADLEKVWADDPAAAAEITALLEEIRNDLDLVEAMAIHQRQEERFHVSKLLEWHAWGWNIWRLKIFVAEIEETLPYRIIYAPDTARRIFHVLAIMHRDQNYERDTDLQTRVKAAYVELEIPRA